MICSKCGAKDVILIRRYSGESLCRECLLDSLFSKLRRSIGKHKLLKEDDQILFTLLSSEVDSPTVEMVIELERRFPRSSLSFLGFDETPSLAEEQGLKFFSIPRPNVASRWDLIPDLTMRSSSFAKDLGLSKVLMPLTLEDSIGLFFFSVSTGAPVATVINGKVLLGRGVEPPVTVVAPFFEIPLDELLLAHGIGWEPKDPILKLISGLENEIPGAKFNLLRTYHRLLKASLLSEN